jgi:hypothetical protein
MEHTSSSKHSSQSSAQKFSAEHLSTKLKALYDFALAQYPSRKYVEESDDAQEFFTSAGAHYRQAVELTTRMALRAANEQQKLNS